MMGKMTTSKKLLMSMIISIVMTLVALSTVTFAWLALNKETHSDGMKLKVESSPNMIIGKTTSEVTSVTSPSESNYVTTFTDAAAAKKPAQHSSELEDGNWKHSTGLRYVTNTDNISTTTGVEKAGSLTYATASTSDFYVDFTVYIASTSAEIANQDLVATLTGSITSGNSGADTLAAASIDFYLGSVSESNYKGTLNTVGRDAITNNASATKTSVTILSNGTIPLNTSYLTIIMRVYIDGGLLKTSSPKAAYINANSIDTSDITLNVTFTASNHA